MRDFLRVSGQKIYDGRRPVLLKGVNLGGWLLMEGYILHSLNVAERVFKKDFAAACGKRELSRFESDFRDNFIRESDIKRIAQTGFNCVRVPFNSRLIETAPYRYSKDGARYLDRVITWARRHGIYVILDLHAACGAQSSDWHADSLGRPELWEEEEFRKRTLGLWEFVADRYKNEPTVAGYDILNEAVTDDVRLLNSFYKRVIARIRSVDRNHILFIEGNKWARDLDCLDDVPDENLVLSIHFYEPIDFTFNFVPQLSYPLKSRQGSWNKKTMAAMLSAYQKISKRRDRPIFVGEFGVNAREGLYGEDRWLADMLGCFNRFGFHWTYWTYKAVKHSIFPDGVFSYHGNPPWVHRQGPRLGWDNYALYWKGKRREMIRSWRTEEFAPNTQVLKTLKNAL